MLVGAAPHKAVLPLDSHARLITRAVFASLLVVLALWVASHFFLSSLVWAAVIAIKTCVMHAADLRRVHLGP
jgi:hypothetical protein